MNKLAGVILVAGLSTGLMGAFAASSSAAPTPPGSYPLGTELTGICLTNPEPLTEQIRTRFQVFKDGVWEPNPETENSALNELTEPPCTEKIESPGLYRIYVTHYYPGGGKSVEYFGPYQIGGPSNPCKNDETEVVAVNTPNGGTTDLSKLVGKHFTSNQILSFDNDVEIELGNKSLIRATKGSRLQIEGCNEEVANHDKPLVKFGLVLGKIWAKVCSALNEKCMDVHISTERVVAGNRGTIFWMSNSHGVTAAHVDEGSITLTPVKGKGKWKTVIVKAGHTATQRGSKAPVVRRAPVDLNPPF
jgi:hypothetical protein